MNKKLGLCFLLSNITTVGLVSTLVHLYFNQMWLIGILTSVWFLASAGGTLLLFRLFRDGSDD